MENKKKRAFTWKERFAYWFDNRVSGGSLGLIRFLIAASIVLAMGVAALIVLFGFQGEEGAAPVFWDSVATVINAWMPSFEDGSPGYLILMSVVAVAGLLPGCWRRAIPSSSASIPGNIRFCGNSFWRPAKKKPAL